MLYHMLINVYILTNHFLPEVKGPGFNSTPDIIKRFWVTLDTTNRYDNITKDSITVFVLNSFLKDGSLCISRYIIVKMH